MAKKASLNLEVDVVNNTASGLKEVEESVAEVADNMGKSAKKPAKDWGGVLELFTGALPRGFQKSIRQFKSVRRSVGRLSKSFKLLKISIAALGLPALILAIEALASNWQSVTDFLGFTNKAQREAQEEFEKTSEALARINTSGEEYLRILHSSNESTEVLEATIAKLNEQFGNAIDTEADLNTQRDQAIKLVTRKRLLEEAELKIAQVKEKILYNTTQIQNELNKAEGDRDYERIAKFEQELVTYKANLVGFTQDAMKYEASLQELVGDTLEVITKREEERKRLEKEKADAEKEAEKERLERERARLANEDFVNSAIKEATDEYYAQSAIAEAKNQDEIDSIILKRQHDRQIRELILRGATEDELFFIRELHDLEVQQLEKEQETRRQEQQQLQLDQEAALFEELAALNYTEEEKKFAALNAEYERRRELAKNNADLLAEIDRQYTADSLAITKEGEEEKARAVSQAQDMLVKNSRSMFAALERTAEEGSAAQKSFAIADVLLQQGVAMANAVAGATKAAKDTGPAAPFTLAAYIASMVGAVLTSFVSIKGILAEADAPTGGVGGGTVTATRPLVPTNVARTETIDSPPSQAFIVQSELQGASLINDNLYGQTSLNPG